MPPLTRQQAAVLGAYLGLLFGPIEDLKNYAARKLNRTVTAHDFTNQEFNKSLRQAAFDDFQSMVGSNCTEDPLE